MLFAGVLLMSHGTSQAEPQRVGPVTVELIAANDGIVAGEPVEVGLHIVPDADWHVYWKNPGDAGLPPRLKWQLPSGWTVSDISWPAPERIDVPPLTSYGYHGDVLYPLTLTPPRDLKVGDKIEFKASAEWLVCKEVCLPGKAELSLTLPVVAKGENETSQYDALFAATHRLVPAPLPDRWKRQAVLAAHTVAIDFSPEHPLSADVAIEFYPGEKGIIDHAAPQVLTRSGESYRLEMVRSPYAQGDPDHLSGVLEIREGGTRANYEVNVPVGGDDFATAATTGGGGPGVWLALLFAFAGGLILNLMPCVLPVLSLKVLSLVQGAGEGRRAALRHGWVFTFGVVLSFWVIAGVMLLLQAGGAQLGWGFQLQSPVFVMILAAFFFLFALNLFGVYEISFTGGKAASAQGRSGLGGAFVSGVTATLVATPCTAPFMGSALGFSLTQPPLVSMLIYTGLGLGMASPYLVLAAFPELLRFLPKPGRWMETFKQALGFVLVATVIWLAWVLSSQAGSTGVIVLMGVLLLLAMAAWIYGRWGHVAAARPVRLVSRSVVVTVLLAGLALGAVGVNELGRAPDASSISDGTGVAWEPFSQKRLDQLLAENKNVFVDFTAAWCLSCQVNERVAFSSEEVQRRFAELGIVPLKADWTNRSEEITRALAAFGRNSVPLYVLYNPAGGGQPTLLPEILTPGIVLDALNQIDPQVQ